MVQQPGLCDKIGSLLKPLAQWLLRMKIFIKCNGRATTMPSKWIPRVSSVSRSRARRDSVIITSIKSLIFPQDNISWSANCCKLYNCQIQEICCFKHGWIAWVLFSASESSYFKLSANLLVRPLPIQLKCMGLYLSYNSTLETHGCLYLMPEKAWQRVVRSFGAPRLGAKFRCWRSALIFAGELPLLSHFSVLGWSRSRMKHYMDPLNGVRRLNHEARCSYVA